MGYIPNTDQTNATLKMFEIKVDETTLSQQDKSIRTPTWSNIRWQEATVYAGEPATLLFELDAFAQSIAEIDLYNLMEFGTQKKSEVIQLNRGNLADGTRAQSYTLSSGFTGQTFGVKKGQFAKKVYIPRNFKPGKYEIGQLDISSTTCLKLPCSDSELRLATKYNYRQLDPYSTDSWSSFKDLSTIPIEILPAREPAAIAFELVKQGDTYLSIRFPNIFEVLCDLKTDLGTLTSNASAIYSNPLRDNLYIDFTISDLNPSQEVTVDYYCIGSDKVTKTGKQSFITSRRISATPTPSVSTTKTNTPTKPSTPTFSAVNFSGNKININVNIGSSSNRPDKVYLVAPKLGFTSANPNPGTINGNTASWSLDLNSVLGGTAIPLEIVGEKDGVKSDPLTGSYNVPSTAKVTSVPAAPTKFSSRIVGTSAFVTTLVTMKENALPTKAFLYSNALGISKSKSLLGEIVGDKAIIEVPIKASMAGKKYPVTIYLTNSKGESKPLVATLSIPAPKVPVLPTALPQPNGVEPVICIRSSMTRVFSGSCPPGWKKQSE
jgi:hypothetical protein